MKRSDIFRKPRPHEVGVARPGDIAELKRSHCRANEFAGLLVQVMGEPHLAEARCAYCGSMTREYMVEVHTDHPEWQKVPGPWFMPISWLKRLDPSDPIDYVKLQADKYRPVFATPEQLVAANK